MKGLQAEEVIDLNESLCFLFARLEAVRMFIAYTAHKNITIISMDFFFKTGFSHSPLKEEVYVSQPEGLLISEFQITFYSPITWVWYPKDSEFELIAYSDADHAGCKDDCKSTSGGLQFLGGKLVSWSSKKQDCTAIYAAEAEYVSLFAYCAQKVSVELYFVKDRLPTAELFTKALLKERFEYLVHRIGMRRMTPATVGKPDKVIFLKRSYIKNM
ncbi:hypothetical protein Tco_0856243 [Tanacetum coccineum]